MSKPTICTVLGAGNFGTAIAQVLAENGHRVHLWNWEGDTAPLKEIEECNENKSYMPGVRLLKNIVPCYSIEDAMRGTSFVFMAIPTFAMEHTISFASRHIPERAVIINVSKGFHPEHLISNATIILRHVRPSLKKNIVAISGPAVASQLIRHNVTAMNIASHNARARKRVQEVLANPFLKLVPTSDVIGIEIAGSFKNVYSILMGVCDGMDISLNTKAALLTEAIHEMGRMIRAMGGKYETAFELAGVGDLIGTAMCDTSRNRRFGEYLGKGKNVTEARKLVGQVVEGEYACKCLFALATEKKQELPLAFMVHDMLTKKGSVKKRVHEYLASMYEKH